MSKLVTKVLATGAAVSMLTLPGLAPVVAAPSLGNGNSAEDSATSPRESAPADPDEASNDSSAGSRSASSGDAAGDEPDSGSDAQFAPEGTKVQLLNITDFHGRISEAGTQVASVVEDERAKFGTGGDNAGTAVLSTGDNIGASTYTSSSQNDTPTLDVLNAIGVQASAVGNHEFDNGLDDLTGRVSDEADFAYSAANVYDKGTENVVDGLDEYSVVEVAGVKIAVIGVVTKDTASLVSPDGIADVDFGDPTDAVNRVAEDIEELPEDERPDMTVVEAHLGASSTESLEDAEASNAEFKKLVTEADASVDAMFTGHTQLPYAFEAPVPGEPDRTRPVIEAGSYGEYVGQVTMEVDGNLDWQASGIDLIETKDKSYDSEVVDKVAGIVSDAEDKAKELGSEVSGTISEDITRASKDGKEDRGAESTLGNLVADALKEGVEETQLEEADFGITNPGGLRTDLLCDEIYNTEEKCEVTVAELNGVLPFANDHGVVTMKGEDVIGLFEEQWQPDGASRPFLHLGISDDLDVVYDSDADKGEHVESVKVDGETIDPKKDYRVATLSFLAAGGDNFTSFAKGDFEQSGLTDFETWENYFNKHQAEGKDVTPDKNERQADAAKDVIDNGDLTAELTGPKAIKPGESADFVLKTNAKSEVAGPIDVTVDLPDGYTAEAAGKSSSQSASADAPEVDAPRAEAEADAAKTISLDSIPAGESETPVTVTAPKDASGEVTVKTSLQANADGPWWDDNPLPLAHEFEATASVVDDANASAGDDGSADGSADGGNADGGAADGGNADGGDSAAGGSDGSSDADGANASADGGNADGANASADGGSADGSGSDANGSKDGGDLPRTGFETFNIVAAALALIVAGGTAITLVRRRKLPT
ncbi:5'-nucleotidase C-terminal domain-containing protein [Brevibacterium spongiae]|uniref:5'-nucleotidase C-terminal domain-containing protein n=1 Tax=Brevibacterium spongiae TaxID=2909672 RepID=A0ABY5SKT6_9MICO|nr:5'-nucleotidase C-terminal domain-containing protein [Brevibacterium spongiae]UVI35153.1 5'-nucleotidase C-terminal domain-containing protein [Brevibacterium spongiae]